MILSRSGNSVFCASRRRRGVSVIASAASSVRPVEGPRNRPLDVIIIGGGIGGFSAASALLEAGARVRVYESRQKADSLTGPGGIQIQANAEKVLRLLQSPWPPATNDASSSLSDAIYSVGGPIMSGGFRSDRGDYLYYADVDSAGLDDIKSNGLSISRRSLMSVLYAALPHDSVTFDRRFQSFTAPPAGEPGRVQVTFADGGVEECDVLVGADGIRSRVREQLLGGPSELSYSGTVCWRGRLPLSRIGRGEEWFLNSIANDSWAEYWGAGVRIGLFTVGPEATPDETAPGGIRIEGEPQVAWYAFANLPADWKPEPGADEAELLRKLFAGFTSPVPELFAAVQSSVIHTAKIFYQEPRPDPWGAGRVTLLGDAAHAMLPTLGQGGCMAIEDALELANELGGAVEPVSARQKGSMASPLSSDMGAVARLEGALRRYEASRAPRTRRVAEQSVQVASLAMADTPLSVWLRNTIYRLTPKWAGDKQFEYLFKDYVPAWREGVRLGRRPANTAAPAATP